LCIIVDKQSTADYLLTVIEVRQTVVFSEWLASLRDAKAVARIDVRELRIDYGPGYRVYFVERRNVVVILLCGGDKRSQGADIALAKKLSKEV